MECIGSLPIPAKIKHPIKSVKRTAIKSAILVVSEELDELFEICDELVVMSEGKISPQVKTKDVSVEEIGRWMSGLWPEAKEQSPPRRSSDGLRHCG